MPPEKPRRLGRGLEALLASRETLPREGISRDTVAEAAPPAERSALRSLPIAEIRPNPYQPRKEFHPSELDDLQNSLKATGLLQPVTVRELPDGRGYELIAGERRLRAATNLGWTEIPAIVKSIDDQTLLTLALVENLQRADLNGIEEAEGYRRLCDEFGLTQQQVAEVVGKDRSTVAQTLRLLGLPAAVRRLVQGGQLSQGHARALLALGEEHAMVELAREAVAQGLTARDVERRVREAGGRRKPTTTGEKAPAQPSRDGRSADVRRIEDHLRRHFQTDVTISVSGQNRGEVRIAFYSTDDFERVLDLLGTRPK
jgi:ParB family transcriptional regulator, chromosome partitioning protein